MTLCVPVADNVTHLAFGNLNQHGTQLAGWLPVPFAAKQRIVALLRDYLNGITSHRCERERTVVQVKSAMNDFVSNPTGELLQRLLLFFGGHGYQSCPLLFSNNWFVHKYKMYLTLKISFFVALHLYLIQLLPIFSSKHHFFSFYNIFFGQPSLTALHLYLIQVFPLFGQTGKNNCAPYRSSPGS